MLRLALAQCNPVTGAVEENASSIMKSVRQASIQGANLVLFPELCLTGYYPGDLLGSDAFMNRVDEALAHLCKFSTKYPWMYFVVGAPLRNPGPGKPLHNGLVVIGAGKEWLRYAKQLLPAYDVYDERRHFEPGPPVAAMLKISGTRVGFLLCDDAWNEDGAAYPAKPVSTLAAAQPDLVVTLNASPGEIGKRERRHSRYSEISRKHGLPFIYLNMIGGQDQMVFDGGSFAVTPAGKVVFEAPRFRECLEHLVFAPENAEGLEFTDAGGSLPPPVSPEGLPRIEFIRRQLVLGLQDYAKKCGFSKVLVGSSGGIDSAVTLALAVQAMGSENVTAITMPSAFSSEGSVADSVQLCEKLGIELLTAPVAQIVDSFSLAVKGATGELPYALALENLQARVRGTVLMTCSNMFGHLLLATGNKSEISVGYCTLYGDTNGGLGLLGDLYKTEVYQLARHLNSFAGDELIPRAILEKPPSAELAPGQRDTDSLPPYELLDEILKLEIEGSALPEAEKEAARNTLGPLQESPEGQALLSRIRTLIARSEFKRRQTPPVIRIRPCAFGSGRQMPIAAKLD